MEAEAVGGAEAEPGPGYRGHDTGLAALVCGLVTGPGLGWVHLCRSSGSDGGWPRLRMLLTSLLRREGDSYPQAGGEPALSLSPASLMITLLLLSVHCTLYYSDYRELCDDTSTSLQPNIFRAGH